MKKHNFIFIEVEKLLCKFNICPWLKTILKKWKKMGGGKRRIFYLHDAVCIPPHTSIMLNEDILGAFKIRMFIITNLITNYYRCGLLVKLEKRV